jgi:TRAP transporter TAXI family solute receptor
VEKKMKFLLSSLNIIAGVAILAGPVSAETVGFATLPAGSINNLTVQVLSKVIQKNSNLKMRVMPLRGAHAMHTAMNSKSAEFGISDIAGMTSALTGAAEYKGRALKNLRVAFRIRTLSVGFYVRKDSKIKTIADIRGKTFSSKWSAFPNAIPLSNGLFATAGMSLKDIDGVPATNIIRSANDFKSGKIDVGFFAIGAPKMAEVNSAVGGIRFINIPNTPENNTKMKTIRGDYFVNVVRPSPVNAGIPVPTGVLGVDMVIDVATHVKDEVVEQFLGAIHPNKAQLVKGHPLFRGFNPKIMARQYSTARYHPGAIKFYKKVGLWK